MKWKRITGGYENPTGEFRAMRHEVDDSWDTGALVRRQTQWILESKNAEGEWLPFELHNSLRAAKDDAERYAQRRAAKAVS